MDENKSDEKKIEFKKSQTVRLKKFYPQNKIDRMDIVKYASTYDLNTGKPEDSSGELFI